MAPRTPGYTTTTVSATASTQSLAGDYHIIPISRIQTFQLLSLALPSNSSEEPTFTDAEPALHALDLRALKAREVSAVRKLQDREAKRGKGVTREAQEVFDAISRTMPVRWDGQQIVVSDSVAIEAPYRVENCQPLHAGNTAALARVRKVVSRSCLFCVFLCLYLSASLTRFFYF